MMKKLFSIFLMGAFLFGCGPEPEAEKPEEKGPLSISINGEVFNYFPTDIVGSTLHLSTPNTFSIGVQYAKEKTEAIRNYGISFGFTDNRFTVASLTYIKEGGKYYRTADFNPLETFSIKNFKLDKNAQTVSFEYEGKMYESSETVNTSGKTITVKGKIDTKITHISGTGGSQPLPMATFTAGNYTFATVRGVRSTDAQTRISYMNCFTNTGERLQLAVDPFFNAIQFPVTFTFDADDTVNNLTFMKFTGAARATGQDILRPEDWKAYPTKGTLTLNKVDHETYNGTFSIEVYDGATLLHKTDNGAIVYSLNGNYPGFY